QQSLAGRAHLRKPGPQPSWRRCQLARQPGPVRSRAHRQRSLQPRRTVQAVAAQIPGEPELVRTPALERNDGAGLDQCAGQNLCRRKRPWKTSPIEVIVESGTAETQDGRNKVNPNDE